MSFGFSSLRGDFLSVWLLLLLQESPAVVYSQGSASLHQGIGVNSDSQGLTSTPDNTVNLLVSLLHLPSRTWNRHPIPKPLITAVRSHHFPRSQWEQGHTSILPTLHSHLKQLRKLNHILLQTMLSYRISFPCPSPRVSEMNPGQCS